MIAIAMKDSLRICISSPPDRERVVAEIFFDDVQWAELNQENEVLQLEFYPRPDGGPWRIDFGLAIKALDDAKRKLTGK
jgi:hypothetical protein